MTKLKNGKVKSQIHLYSNPDLYNGFKETIKQINNNTNNDYGISEIIRALMFHFCKSAEFQDIIIKNINNNGGVADDV